MKNLILTAGLGLMSVSGLVAQTTSIADVRRIAIRNVDAIKQGTEVKGYYFFYASDKVDRRTNEYTLHITDDKLGTLKDVTFQDSKDVTMLESSFNGTDLIFLLYNDKARTFEYQVYGADGKKKASYIRELTKKERRYLEQTYLATTDEESNYKGLYPVDGKGFVSNMPSREDKDYTFQVDFFSSEKNKQWTYTPTEGGKKFIGDYLGTFGNIVYFEVLKFGSKMDQNPDSYLLGLDLQTGRQLFEKSTQEGKFKFYPASMTVLNDGSAFIFGEYFNPNGNVAKDKSLGFSFWSIDAKGAVVSEKYLDWDLDMGKFLKVNSKGKIDDFGYMYLQNMVQAADGSIFAVGEGYKKVASGFGIAAKVVAGGNSGISTVKIKVTDMIMLRFDDKFNVKDAKIYEKNPNKIELQSGMEFVSAPLLGKLIKYNYGGFDYSYTQVNSSKTAFSVCYSDYERGKDYKGATFNSISYYDGKLTTDKIQTKSDATTSSVLPAKQGQVLILEYFKKAKRLDAHFEKLN